MTFSPWSVVVFFVGLFIMVAVWGWDGLDTTLVTIYFVTFAAAWIGGMILVDMWHERRHK